MTDLSIGVIAGEASGDNLGAGLIEAVRAKYPDARFVGVAGPKMRAAGCETWERAESVAVMGLTEVIGHLPRLLRLRSTLVKRFTEVRPQVFVGIDAPDFNLGVEERLRRAGIPTVHYVSPTVWAWRPGRVKTVSKAADLVLCIFPFEKDYYDQHGVAAEFVGHPLADEIPLHIDRDEARGALGLSGSTPLVAVLPGSREGEVGRLGDDFAGAMAWLHAHAEQIRFVVPMANEQVRSVFESAIARHAPGVSTTLLNGKAHQAIAASDAVLLASGTASLEAALLKRPMVVAYRVSALTRWFVDTFRLIKVKRIALPNLLTGKDLVPEILQDEVTPERLGRAVLSVINDPARVEEIRREFQAMHLALRQEASQRAAEAVLRLIDR